MNKLTVGQNIKFQLEDKSIKVPEYATDKSSGMDIRAYLSKEKDYYLYGATKHINDKGDLEIHVHPGGRALIPSGLKVEVPDGYELEVRPRSGLALKSGITILNSPGTIDSDYRGDIGVIIHNTSNQIFMINNGDRIAQLVLNTVPRLEIEEGEISETKRGEGGFGSTGKE